MLAYIARRLLVAIPVFVGVMVVSFLIVRLLPGDPVQLLLDPEQLQGPAGQEFLARKRAELGLDQPLPIQFIVWAGQVLHGDFGTSFQSGEPVSSLFLQRLGPTVLLMTFGVVVALVVGVPLGTMSALRPYGKFDTITGVGSMLGISMPGFFLSLAAVYVFALQLRILPSAGMQTLGEDGSVVDLLRHLVLPGCVLAATLLGPYVRYTRQGMLEVLGQDYLTTATAKGVPRPTIVVGHALRNALVPLTTAVAVQIPALLAGTVLIEKIFAWPGLGGLMLDAITARDYPIVIAAIMLTALLVLVCNLVADLVAAALDPRIRLS